MADSLNQTAIDLIATAMLGSVRWRPNMFLCGAGGGGKSTLTDVMRAAGASLPEPLRKSAEKSDGR